MPTQQTILLAGASRGLGLGLATAYLAEGWHVIATARTPGTASGLAALQTTYPDHLTIEQLDVASPDSVHALATRLSGRSLDVLFVVAGISTNPSILVHEAAQEDVAREFITNATAPIVLAEALGPNLAPHATVAFMTSLLGSIASNAGGGMELYRATKSALNMLASCYALRHKETSVLLIHPGWVRTELGGANAPIDVATSVAGMVRVLGEHGGKAGLAYLDYRGQTLPW